MVFIKKGDIIDIIAPARFTEQGPFEAYSHFLEGWGLVPRVHEHTFGHDDFYANTLDKRVEALQAAVESPDSKGVWCIQGGYGTTQVLSALPHLKPSRPKFVMGLSNCTALLFYAYKHWPWTVIHGPTLNKLVFKTADADTTHTVEELLFGRATTIDYGTVEPLNSAAACIDRLTGKAVGGNMCLLQTALGTPWLPPLEDGILFLEDVNENPLRILERMHHLKNAGLFKNIKALVLFDLTVNEEDQPLLLKALHRIGQELDMPVFKGQGVGHEARSLPVVFGQPFEIEGGKLKQVLNVF